MKNAKNSFCIALAFFLYGCSASTRIPAEFSRQVSSADRLVITNRYYAVGATITGTNVNNIITAIKSSRTKKWGTGMDWEDPFVCKLEFYVGTNHVAGVPADRGVFNLDGVEYYDGSGIMEALCKKVTENRTH